MITIIFPLECENQSCKQIFEWNKLVWEVVENVLCKPCILLIRFRDLNGLNFFSPTREQL